MLNTRNIDLNDPLLDQKTLRFLMPLKKLKSLPIKYIYSKDLEKQRELYGAWTFNPPYYYPKYFRKSENEFGHDDKYRYIMSDIPQPLYEKDGNEVWLAKDYLRPINMSSSQHFWLVMGAVVVSTIVFAGILLVVEHFLI